MIPKACISKDFNIKGSKTRVYCLRNKVCEQLI